MIKNYLQIAVRNLMRSRVFSFINIFGLALSMSVCMMVILRAKNELSYDRFHPAVERTYRIINNISNKQRKGMYVASTPMPLLPLLKDSTLVAEVVNVSAAMRQDVSYGDKALSMQGAFTQSSFFRVFGFQLAEGSKQDVLDQPGSIVLSAEAASNLFGSERPMGKIVNLDKLGAFIVKGVLAPQSEKTHLNFDVFLSSSSLPLLEKGGKTGLQVSSWNTFQPVYTYVELKPGVSRDMEEKRIARIGAGAGGLTGGNGTVTGDVTYAFQLQALSDITPSSLDLYNDIGGGAGWTKIWAECGIALLILLAGCFNYTNLTIARGLTRSKEVGVRKINGARRYQIFIQYIIESIVFALVALVLSLLILSAILKYKPFNDGYEFMPDVTLDRWTFLIFLVFSVFAGVLAGALPAWILSSFKPVEVLKNIRTKKLFGNLSLQKTLIVFQFSLSLLVLIFLSAFYKQFSHLAEIDPGFNYKNVLSVSLDGADPDLLGNAVMQNNGVLRVSAVSGNFSVHNGAGSTPVALGAKGKEPIQMSYYMVDEKTAPMMNLKFVAGENFSAGERPEKEAYVLINERAARVMSFKDNKDAINQLIRLDDTTEVQIKGVVADFYFQGTGNFIRPMLLRMKKNAYAFLDVQVSQQGEDVLDRVRASWKKLYPTKSFNYYWYQQRMEDGGKQTGTLSLLGFLGLITITIGTLGLLGLVIYTVETRQKELSIRKVIGASVPELLALVGKGFVKLLFVSGVIAGPLGYLLSFLFLQNFANRASFGVVSILLCFVFLLLVGLVTIVSQTWKAATSNPAHHLRME
ncbi:MAG: ABC transporter permease [Bacteroidetes bacterium]|nr:ABC transporter permease [Bacteroidota bacterium]